MSVQSEERVLIVPAGQSGWQLVAALACLSVVVAALYWPTSQSLRLLWQDFDNLAYTHGYLILGVCVWLLWRTRAAVATVPVAMDRRALGLLAVFSFLWLLTLRSGIEIAGQLLLPLIAWTGVWAAFGSGVARKTVFAFAYFYFAVPIWSLGNGVLQTMTVHAVGWVLAVTGFSAYVTDNYVHIPDGVFEIAGGCAGLHFFVVALALAALYGEVNQESGRTRMYLLALAAGLALLSNWLRVYIIIVAGYLTHMHHPLIRDHYYFGWKLFAGMLVVFFVVARYLPLPPAAVNDSSQLARSHAGKVAWGAIIGVMAVAALGPAWWWLRDTLDPASNGPKVTLPTPLASWNMVPSRARWEPLFSGADELQRVTYRAPGTAGVDIEVLMAVYYEQRQGKELVADGNSVLGSDELLSRQVIDAGAHPLNELQVRDGQGSRALIWYGYRVGNRRTTSELEEQLLYGVQSLIGAPVSRVVALRAACADRCDETRSRLRQLATALQSADIR